MKLESEVKQFVIYKLAQNLSLWNEVLGLQGNAPFCRLFPEARDTEDPF